MKYKGLKNSALETLKTEVLNTDACTGCGTCVNLCPNIISTDDRVAAIGNCTLNTGRCWRYCPRTPPVEEIKDSLSGDVGFENPLGRFVDITLARSTLSAKSRSFQAGGVASALLWQALQDDLINCAVVTGSSSNMPQAMTIWNKEEIFEAVGSKFALSPTNKEVNLAIINPDARIGVVALPCQATGLRKKELLAGADDPQEGKIVLIIGLFCTWALDQQGWRVVLREYVGAESIRRIDIPPPPAAAMEITTDQRTYRISLNEVRTHIRPGCKVCLDMTAENADVSTGMAEGVAGYNTVIIRSDIGKKLFGQAFKRELLKKIPYRPALLKSLQYASMHKKMKAIAEAEGRTEPLDYYRRLKELKEKITP
jgi:coenzyme F420 hydrogenase subunit beta